MAVTVSGTQITFNDSTTQSTAALATAQAKAWVSFNGANGSRYGSYNVSSVTRSSAGFYQVNFTTALPNSNYAAVANCSAQNLGQFITFLQMYEPSFQAAAAPTTTSFYFGTHGAGGGGVDPDFVTAVVFG